MRLEITSKIKLQKEIYIFILFAILLLFPPGEVFGFKAKNVFIVLADQFRYDETFGDNKHLYIPRLWKELVPKGSHCITFYGNPTFMSQTHLAILTGSWDDIRRIEPKTFPDKPTIFEYYRKKLDKPIESCYIVSSKKEYFYLENSNSKEYGKNYKPYLEITKKEKDDNELYEKLSLRMKTYHPSLVTVLIGSLQMFNKKRKEDEILRYRQQLKVVDEIIYKIWTTIQTLPEYKDNTDLFFLNDHGDLMTHEDCDDECKRYLIIFAIGPDIKENYVSEKKWRQVNIVPTALKIFGLTIPKSPDVIEDFLLK